MPRLFCLIFSLAFFQNLIVYACVHKYSESKAQVLDVSDYGTLILSDNRTVRLAGVILPFVPDEVSEKRNWRGSVDSISKIKSLLTGKNIQLHHRDMRRDRYGIWPAYIYAVVKGKKVWVQKKLVEDGFARVSPINYKSECIRQLLDVEGEARRSNRGLWKYEAFGIRSAKDVWKLMRLVDRFQVVEGKVADAVAVKGRVYLNFGKDWRRDFTVKISRSSWKRFTEKGLSLSSFKGRMVRVRGWVQLRNGPLIEVKNPDIIEFIGNGKKPGQGGVTVSTDW
ncbi:MAG: thermonuclease family protein [Methyloligellaceae bacterium]